MLGGAFLDFHMRGPAELARATMPATIVATVMRRCPDGTGQSGTLYRKPPASRPSFSSGVGRLSGSLSFAEIGRDVILGGGGGSVHEVDYGHNGVEG